MRDIRYIFIQFYSLILDSYYKNSGCNIELGYYKIDVIVSFPRIQALYASFFGNESSMKS